MQQRITDNLESLLSILPSELVEVIHDIDERMTERSQVREDTDKRPSVDRITRVLIGYRHGVTVSDVSRRGAVIKVPDERYGLVFVFRVFDRISYALVMKVSIGSRNAARIQGN